MMRLLSTSSLCVITETIFTTHTQSLILAELMKYVNIIFQLREGKVSTTEGTCE